VLDCLHGLSPELGTHECCRRALAGIARVMQLRGAAIVLRDGDAVVHGTFAVEPLARAWPRGDAVDALPRIPFAGGMVRDPALRDALAEAEVVGVVPLVSPRRRWGHLFLTTGLLGATFIDEDARLLDTFAAQLALVLDGAELLARSLSVERALAHAEKLAAIGELAARIAHEIRNPVTAARSLAQQLGREPQSPLNAEHAQLILTELERVERQVAALLRFARREEFQFAAVELDTLVRATVDELRPRLEAAGVTTTLAAERVTARADREKLRQVLINVIENALDALRDAAGERRLAIDVGRENGAATIQVSDTGPGVPGDALPRLFEPFYSLKPQGTGLGLAIVRRTVEAHGGRVAARSTPGSGLALSFELPLADTPPETTR
jgi:signal transduction histidine kinase